MPLTAERKTCISLELELTVSIILLKKTICSGKRHRWVCMAVKSKKIREAQAVPVLIHGSNSLFPARSPPVSEAEPSFHERIVITWYYLRFKLEWRLLFSTLLREKKLSRSFTSEMPKEEVLTAPSVRSKRVLKWNFPFGISKQK